MTWEIYFVLSLLAYTVVSFIWERISPDLTALSVFSILIFVSTLTPESTLPPTESLLSVFGNSAPITIAGMFIVSASLECTGAIDAASRYLRKLLRLPYPTFLLVMILSVAATSAFVNNTPVVIVLMPVVTSLGREMKVPASKLLIPLSFASIFGGTCTLLGTSTNLLASGLLKDAGYNPIGMFELSIIGLPLLLIGTIFLVVFSHRILPNRETTTSIIGDAAQREFIAEAFVQANSPLIGQPLGKILEPDKHGVRVLEIIRHGIAIKSATEHLKLKLGDRLVLSCRPAGIEAASAVMQLEICTRLPEGLETISIDKGCLIEGMVAPHSSIIGKALADINFRQRFRMNIIAIHRKGKNQIKSLNNLKLESGDTLLMIGSHQAIQALSTSNELIALENPRIATRKTKMPYAIAVAVGIVTIASLKLAPISALVLLGSTLLMLTNCLRPRQAYESIEWNILTIIFGMLALGKAMESTGASLLIAETMRDTISSLAPEHLQPVLMLAMIYLVTSASTEFLSNNAAVALMIPISIGIALALEVNPRPFAIGTCIAASASFATPIGYQTNTYVYGAGGYRFSDFARIGIPLNIIYMLVTVILVPIFWDF